MTTEKNIIEYIDLIDSREIFLDFLSLLQEDFLDNKEDWENQTIYTYLDGMIGFTTDKEFLILDLSHGTLLTCILKSSLEGHTAWHQNLQQLSFRDMNLNYNMG